MSKAVTCDINNDLSEELYLFNEQCDDQGRLEMTVIAFLRGQTGPASQRIPEGPRRIWLETGIPHCRIADLVCGVLGSTNGFVESAL